MYNGGNVKSISILNFFRNNKLSQDVKFYFNASNNDSIGLSEVFEGQTPYKFYIPLDKEIHGYNRILVSEPSAFYVILQLLAFGNDSAINDLRVGYYPWPLIVLPSKKYRSGYYDEIDSVVDVMVRYDSNHNFEDRNVPNYKRLIFKGIEPVYDYQEETLPERYQCSNTRRGFLEYAEDNYDTFLDSEMQLERYYDDLISGEAVEDD